MTRRPAPSLKQRLVWISLLCLPPVLGLAGWLLDHSFARSLLAAQSERLQAQTYLVLAAIEFREGELRMPDTLADPRYGQPDSDLFALIDLPGAQGPAWAWRSLSAQRLSEATLNESRRGDVLRPGQGQFRVLSSAHQAITLFEYRLAVIWEHLDGRETPLVLHILESDRAWQAERRAHRTAVWLALGMLALVWCGVLVLLVRWGLRPLDRLAADLTDIEQGRQALLSGDYPAEVQLLTRRLNQLIRSEREQRERYRTTLADLAHSLKTPLAVIRTHLMNTSPDRDDIEAQVARMDQLVAYQLQRAVRAAEPIQPTRVALWPLLQRLLATLDKVYRDKALMLSLSGDEGACARGDERDLLEVFGNLLDNACKYGRQRVQVQVSAGRAGEPLRVRITDDGPGIPAERWPALCQRGVRADERAPGQGIGLAVVADILASYGARCALIENPSTSPAEQSDARDARRRSPQSGTILEVIWPSAS